MPVTVGQERRFWNRNLPIRFPAFGRKGGRARDARRPVQIVTKTDYSQGIVVEQHKKAKDQPWRSRIETCRLMKLIGGLSGKKNFDVACDKGFFHRVLRRSGASKVMGLDISERMIVLARDQEATEPLGMEYWVKDALSIVEQQDFNSAVSAWVYNFSPPPCLPQIRLH